MMLVAICCQGGIAILPAVIFSLRFSPLSPLRKSNARAETKPARHEGEPRTDEEQ